jgi:hypothetical protein
VSLAAITDTQRARRQTYSGRRFPFQGRFLLRWSKGLDMAKGEEKERCDEGA